MVECINTALFHPYMGSRLRCASGAGVFHGYFLGSCGCWNDSYEPHVGALHQSYIRYAEIENVLGTNNHWWQTVTDSRNHNLVPSVMCRILVSIFHPHFKNILSLVIHLQEGL